jgi:hypothetical protein
MHYNYIKTTLKKNELMQNSDKEREKVERFECKLVIDNE